MIFDNVNSFRHLSNISFINAFHSGCRGELVSNIIRYKSIDVKALCKVLSQLVNKDAFKNCVL